MSYFKQDELVLHFTMSIQELLSDLLSAKHDVGGPLQAVDDGLSAGVQVIVLVLDDRVVHVHGRNQELAALRQLVQAVNASNGLFNDSLQTKSFLKGYPT